MDQNQLPPAKLIPVIHYRDDEQVMRNAKRAFDAGADGVMVIHMHGINTVIPSISQKVKETWPDKLVGINLINEDPVIAVRTSIGRGLDMTWTDDQLTHSANDSFEKAARVKFEASKNPNHTVFCGVAFKYQKIELSPEFAAHKALEYGFIPTTSGFETGKPPSVDFVRRIYDCLTGDKTLAIASGITPENVQEFTPFATHLLVSTGVSLNFYEFDSDKLSRLRVMVDLTTIKFSAFADMSLPTVMNVGLLGAIVTADEATSPSIISHARFTEIERHILRLEEAMRILMPGFDAAIPLPNVK